MWTRPRLLAVAAAIVLVVGAMGALAYANRSSSSRVQTLDPSTDTTVRPSTTSTETSLAASETSSSSSSSSSSQSTTSVTESSASSSASTPDCTPDDLAATTQTDKASYSAGETVTVTITLRNTSNHTCVQQQVFPYTFGSSVKVVTEADRSTLIWRRGARGVGLFAQQDPRTLAPGDEFTWTTVQWDQHFCQAACATDQPGGGSADEGGLVPPGTYLAFPADETPPPAGTVTPASFQVTA